MQITTTSEAEEAVTQAFYDAGANGVAIESRDDVVSLWDDPTVNLVDESLFDRPDDQSVITGYFPDEDKTEQKIQEILVKISKLPSFGLNPGEADLKVKPVEDDWLNSWKKYFIPTKVSEHGVVVPSWENYDPEKDEYIIHMDPGMAFGTGTHETTKLCVQAIEDYVKEGDLLLDIGCGTGILSIAGVKSGANEAIGVDLDPLAVKASEENAELNSVTGQTTFIEGDLLSSLPEGTKADIVVANILAQVITTFVADLKEVLKPGGYFISSGIITQYLDLVLDALEENGFEVVEKRQMNDWHAVIAKLKEDA